MVLRLIVCIMMVAFCLYAGFSDAANPSPEGGHYFPFVYIVCIAFLLGGLNRFGLITWPIVTILLLIEGHYIVGWVPAALVAFNLVGNQLVAQKRL